MGSTYNMVIIVQFVKMCFVNFRNSDLHWYSTWKQSMSACSTFIHECYNVLEETIESRTQYSNATDEVVDRELDVSIWRLHWKIALSSHKLCSLLEYPVSRICRPYAWLKSVNWQWFPHGETRRLTERGSKVSQRRIWWVRKEKGCHNLQS